MRRTLIILPALAIFYSSFLGSKKAVCQNAPVARVENVVDEHFGVKVNDPYRYMEDLDAPEVQQFIKGQADYAANILSKLPARQNLLNRLKELDIGRPFNTYGYRILKDGTLFYKKRVSGENLYKLYVRKTSGEDKLLIDPQQVPAEKEQHYSLESYTPSFDGHYVVYGLAKSGSEETVLHVLNVESGESLPETIDRIENAYNRPHWLPDGSGFFYSRRRLLPDGAPATEIYKKTKVFFHKLNTPVEKDKVIAGFNVSDRMPLDENDFPSLYIPPGSNHAVVKVKHGDANELTLYTTPIETLLEKDIPWKKICDIEDEVAGYAVHGDNIFLKSAKNASRSKVIQTSLIIPDLTKAKTVVPEGEAVIDYVITSSKSLYTGVVDGGVERILRIDFDEGDTIKTMKLPDNASGFVVAAGSNAEAVMILTNSWIKGSVIFAFNPADESYTENNLLPKGKFDNLDGFEAVEVKVKSHDQVMVPLTIIHKKDIKLNRQNPTLVVGYGAYGITNYAYFSPLRIAWLERGGVLAIAHVRGGGEYGKAWHLAGQKLTKPNTWKDFIACAEYLIENNYTSHNLIAAQGGSAGGITVGRAITERPDLFKAAIINVGSLDAIRMETTANGVPNIPEFGTVKTEDGFKGLLAMSSYHHVEDGIKYPAVLLTHGMNDPRVDPWNSAKMTARLQAATASNNPVLFRVEYSAGHGVGSTRMQYIEELADIWGFLFWQFGIE